MKKCLVCGSSGFIGRWLVRRLKEEGNFVAIVDVRSPVSDIEADRVFTADLRDVGNCRDVVQDIDEVYQLAADFGGMGYIGSHEVNCLCHNVQINANMAVAVRASDVKRVFYSSSVCIYPDMKIGQKEMDETEAYPPNPDNEYGWEKLYSERIWRAIGRNTNVETRIARFQNTYGPEAGWYGGREKAPAALCRKIASAKDGGKIDVWGDGTAIRSYTYIDDLTDGIRVLMDSDVKTPVNIGSSEMTSVNELIATIEKVSGKKIRKNYVKGPVGVVSRNFSKSVIQSLGWKAKTSLEEGISKTYPWIAKQCE